MSAAHDEFRCLVVAVHEVIGIWQERLRENEMILLGRLTDKELSEAIKMGADTGILGPEIRLREFRRSLPKKRGAPKQHLLRDEAIWWLHHAARELGCLEGAHVVIAEVFGMTSNRVRQVVHDERAKGRIVRVD